jgi:hypothetical protein
VTRNTAPFGAQQQVPRRSPNGFCLCYGVSAGRSQKNILEKTKSDACTHLATGCVEGRVLEVGASCMIECAEGWTGTSDKSMDFVKCRATGAAPTTRA